MAKKKPSKPTKTAKAAGEVKTHPEPIILKTGEAPVEADAAWSAAEPEVVIGQLSGPVGYAIAELIGNQVKGHSKVFAILSFGAPENIVESLDVGNRLGHHGRSARMNRHPFQSKLPKCATR